MYYIGVVVRERPEHTRTPEGPRSRIPRLTSTAMFTALQFSQLVAAAWSGPAACHFATISHYVSSDGYAQTQYSASYHIGQDAT